MALIVGQINVLPKWILDFLVLLPLAYLVEWTTLEALCRMLLRNGSGILNTFIWDLDIHSRNH